MTLELTLILTLDPELTIRGDNEYRGFPSTPRDNSAAHLLFDFFFLAKGPLRKPLQRRSLPASGRDSRRNLVGETRKVSLMPRRGGTFLKARTMFVANQEDALTSCQASAALDN
jgi:hypothetical protein